MQKEISPRITFLTFGILVVAFLAAFYVIAWQEPTLAPPQGNVPAPINVGTDPQAKPGRISATEFYDYNDPAYYFNPSGTSKLRDLIFSPASPPVFPVEGQTYFNQTDKNLYYFDGTKWMKIGLEAVTQCGVCRIWDSTAGQCVPLPAGTKDAYCSTLHYACDGAGNCTAPTQFSGCLLVTAAEVGKSGYVACQGRGYDGCSYVWNMYECYPGCTSPSGWKMGCENPLQRCYTGDDYRYGGFECWNWVYD